MSDSDVWQVAVAFCAGCSQVIENLSPGQTYVFRVSANNEVGIGQPGESSFPITIPDLGEIRVCVWGGHEREDSL